MPDPLQFSDLYGDPGLGFLAQDSQSGSAAARKRAVNDAHLELAGIKGYWRKRSFDYTASSSPALTDGTRKYAVPTDFDSVFRLYYRISGKYVEISFKSDSEWLELSFILATIKGYPEWARLVQDSAGIAGISWELNRATSAPFITSIGTITLEYFTTIAQMVNDSDNPILPPNLRQHIVTVAGLYYAMAQGDNDLYAQLTRVDPVTRTSPVSAARAAVYRHDLTRTGKVRQMRPKGGYEPYRQMRTGYDYR